MTSDRVPPAVRLAAAIQDYLSRIPVAEPFLEGWPPLDASRPAASADLPVLGWLGEAAALGTPETLPIIDILLAAAGHLSWRQTYTVADFGPAFLHRYGWTELVGLRGPIPSRTIACGFLMLGPEVDYPAHAHEAEELYLPLAGSALWMKGSEGYAVRSAGMPILHGSWMPHAMRTQAEPLLALYVWRGGDLAAKSKIILED